MRNLKKVLSLSLALVMLLGMMVVGAGAATTYTDANDINYTEAVDVMSAVGVFSGTDKGDFQPNGDLTREQAAKIITYMLMGQDAADKLTAAKAPYKDVAANRWSAGSVAYCTTMNIIAGDGNGAFYPTQTVNGYAFAKMLLVALGYDPAIQNYTGSSWAINVSKDALAAGLTAGLDVSLANTLTREQAAQMAFNTLKADMVYYTNKGTEITTDGMSVVVGASAPTKVAHDPNSGYLNGTNDAYTQFCEQYFSKLKLSNTGSDAFERTANAWSLVTGVTNRIGTYAATPAVTYTQAVSKATIYNDLGLSAEAKDVDYYVDGAATVYTGDTNTNSTGGAIDIARGDQDMIGGNGVLTQVYTTNGAVSKIVCVNTYVGDVTAVVGATANRDAYITVASRGVGVSGNFETTGFAVKDVVLYTYSNKSGETGVQSVVKAETLTGALSSFTTGKTATVGGTTYSYSAKAANQAASGSVGKDVTVVLDSYGYIIDMTGVQATDNYAYVLQAPTQGSGIYGDQFYAQLLLADGTIVDAKVNGSQNSLEKKLVTYTVGNNDVYTLKDTGATAKDNATDFALKRGESTVTQTSGNTVVANGNTVFLVKTGAAPNEKYTAYTGIANVPSITAGANNQVSSIAYVKGNVAAVMYIDATKAASISTNASNPIYVYGDAKVSQTVSADGSYYTYKAVVNGEITTINSATQITAPTMYSDVSYNDKGIATLSGNTGITAGTGTVKESNGVIGLNSAYYGYANDVKVFYVDAQGNITASSIASINTDATDGVKFALTNSVVSLVVVEQVVNTANAVTAVSVNVNGANQALVAGNSATAGTISGAKPADGAVITIVPTVSGGATVASITVTGTTGNGAIGGSSYTVNSSDTKDSTVTFTIVVVSESGVTANATYTLTLGNT